MRPKDILLQWIAAFNNADIETIANLYDDNAINHQVANEPVIGKQAIKKMFTDEFHAAKMVCQPDNIFEDGDWTILEWSDPLGLRGCGFFQIKNDKIVFQRGYWDKLSLMKQTAPSDFDEGKKQFLSLISKTEKVLLKLKEGTPQHTLSSRRLAAYKLAVLLMDKKLTEKK